MSDSILERAVQAARTDMPPRLDDAKAQMMIDEALAAVAARPPARAWWRSALAVASMAAVAALVWAFAKSPDSARTPPQAVVSDLILPTGDRIATTPGAHLEVASLARDARSIRLTDGAALFDVRPLGDGEHFVVYTPDSEISVVGTVFTVEVIAQKSFVRVYEGKVRVRRGSYAFTLTPGEQLTRDSAVGHTQGDPLHVLASARARERTAVATVPPVEADAVEPRSSVTTNDSIDSIAPPRPTHAEPRAASVDATADPTPAMVDPIESAPSSPPAAVEDAATPAQAIALLADRKFAAARDLAHRNGWNVIEGDAHRALGAYAEAAAAYEHAIAKGDGDTCVAALLAGRVHAEHLGSPERALHLLTRAAQKPCGTRERALALTIQIATRMKRPDLGISAARAYVADYPNGDLAAAAHALIAE